MSVRPDTERELARALEGYGQAIAHKAALEAATLLDRQSPYLPSDADMLLRRAAQDLASALREVYDAR